MSKLVYCLDVFVWCLLVVVFSTQVLQIAGILDRPKDFSDFTYTQNEQYEFQIGVDDGNRDKRQTSHSGSERSEILDNLFNVPIATLTAVNEFLQSTRPAIQRLRTYAQSRAALNEKNQTKQPTKKLN